MTTPHASAHAAAHAPRPRTLVPAVSRALTLLERLARQGEPMSLARLASELALPKSSVHGLCSTLESFGYLRRQDDGAFRIGPGVMPLAEAFVSSTGIAQEFNALWREAAPDETVVLSVLSGAEVVYIAARNGSKPLGLAFNVGMRLPAQVAATGKAMLAFQPPATVVRLLGEEVAAALARELAQTRRRGHSVDDEGVRAGVYAIAAPVFDAAGQPTAGIGICLNKTRLAAAALARHRDTVLHCARTLTARLGGVAPTPSGR